MKQLMKVQLVKIVSEVYPAYKLKVNLSKRPFITKLYNFIEQFKVYC